MTILCMILFVHGFFGCLQDALGSAFWNAMIDGRKRCTDFLFGVLLPPPPTLLQNLINVQSFIEQSAQSNHSCTRTRCARWVVTEPWSPEITSQINSLYPIIEQRKLLADDWLLKVSPCPSCTVIILQRVGLIATDSIVMTKGVAGAARCDGQWEPQAAVVGF